MEGQQFSQLCVWEAMYCDNGEQFEVDGVFIEIGSIPNSDLAKRIGIETNKKGEIKINRKSETNIPGIYAAGDVADAPFKQAITGVSEGVIGSDGRGTAPHPLGLSMRHPLCRPRWRGGEWSTSRQGRSRSHRSRLPAPSPALGAPRWWDSAMVCRSMSVMACRSLSAAAYTSALVAVRSLRKRARCRSEAPRPRRRWPALGR